MTTDQRGTTPRHFVSSVLPWVSGVAGLLVYGFTASRWITFSSLETVAQTAGWTWRPETAHPLAFVLLYPFHFLPESILPFSLNLFTILCASGVLAILAHCVALLPHDLAPDDILRKQTVTLLSVPKAWMAPVLGVIVCGLQLSFWENATSASGDMIDLLLFAYVLRCLLEFGVQPKECWIRRATFLYAAGLVDNWVMIGLLPVFLIALARTIGFRRCLDRRLLGRLGLCGVAGLSLYVLLPLAQNALSGAQSDFIGLLVRHFKFQWLALEQLRVPEIRIVALTVLLPMLVLSIRWKSHTAQLGDDTPLGVFLIKMTGHLLHAVFLFSALWVAFDPSFSPRHKLSGTAMLICYYISALVFGYCVGYFLLFAPKLTFGIAAPPARGPGFRLRLPASFENTLIRLPRVFFGVLMVVLPGLLLWKNFHQVQLTNGPALHEFATQLYSDLPDGRSAVLSDDGRQLLLLQAEIGRHSRDKDPMPLNTSLLAVPKYQQFMARRFKSRWPGPLPTNSELVIPPFQVREMVWRLAETEPVVYLHPSSGLLVEPFDDEPHGLVHDLKRPSQTQELAEQLLPESVVATNAALWERRWNRNLKGLAQYAAIENRDRSWMRHAFRLEPERNPTMALLGAFYAKSLDFWGVQMQRSGHWAEAAAWFQRALELNPDNLPARINLLYNERCRKGDRTPLDRSVVEEQFRSLFERFEDWGAVLNAGGPVDEPTYLLQSARVVLPGRNFRQAIRELLRCSILAPGWAPPKLWLAQSYLQQDRLNKVLEECDQLKSSLDQLKPRGRADFLYYRATALIGLGRTNEALVFLENFIGERGDQDEIVVMGASVYEQNLQFAKELALLNDLLKRNPNREGVLAAKGVAQLRLSQFQEAAVTLTKALDLAPQDSQTRLNRAAAYLATGQMESARADYRELINQNEYQKAAWLGLGEIAWRGKNTNDVIEAYQSYLSNANPKWLQYKLASKRLAGMKAGPAP